MNNTNSEILDAPIRRQYNFSAKALEQRSIAAKKPRQKEKKALLMILEKKFDARFKNLLIQYSLKVLKKRCEECRMKNKNA